jgi:radical SAM protein with 4Fe4S-binding SPASM domain
MLDRRKIWGFFDGSDAEERLDYFKHHGDCYPLHVIIHPTISCNHSCNFCYHMKAMRGRKNAFEPKELDANYVTRLIEEMRELCVKNIILSGGGEPLMHPAIATIISKLNSTKIGSFLYTNLDLEITPELLDEISELGGIGVNINFSDPERYVATRGKKVNLERVKGNIDKLVSHGSKLYGTIIVSYAQAYVERTVDFCLEAGMVGVNVSPAFDADESVTDTLKQIKKRFAHCPVRVVGPLEKVIEKDHKVFCQSHRFDVTIGADYGIYPCCYAAYREEFLITNLSDHNSFRQAWESEMRKDWVDHFEPGCKTCWFAPVNQQILQEIK